jgi:hypothetical protein
MKKLVSIVTATVFTLGLVGAGFAQGPAKEGEKPKVQQEAPAGQAQVAPTDPTKPVEKPKSTTQSEGTQSCNKAKPSTTKQVKNKKDAKKKPETTLSPSTPVEQPKKDTK